MPEKAPQVGDGVRVRIGELNLLSRVHAVSTNEKTVLIRTEIAVAITDFQRLGTHIPEGYEAPYKWEVEVSWR